jgi:hypothetical protein
MAESVVESLGSRKQQPWDSMNLVIEMKLLERRLTLYEEKYGVLSEDFYAGLDVRSIV